MTAIEAMLLILMNNKKVGQLIKQGKSSIRLTAKTFKSSWIYHRKLAICYTNRVLTSL